MKPPQVGFDRCLRLDREPEPDPELDLGSNLDLRRRAVEPGAGYPDMLASP